MKTKKKYQKKKNCSLFGIVGVTDKCLEALSQTCSATLTTLDVNGCIGIKVCTMKIFQFSFFSILSDIQLYFVVMLEANII